MALQTIITICTTLIGIGGFCIAYRQYTKQKRFERFSIYRQFAERFTEVMLLDNNLRIYLDKYRLGEHSEEIKNFIRGIDPVIKRRVLGFYEELAVAIYSEFIPIEFAHYNFGFFVFVISECEDFWLNKDGSISNESGENAKYWALYFKLSDDFSKLDKKYTKEWKENVKTINHLPTFSKDYGNKLAKRFGYFE